MMPSQFTVLVIILLLVGTVLLCTMWRVIRRAKKQSMQNALESFDGDEVQMHVAMMAFKTGKTCVGDVDENGQLTITVLEENK